MRGRMVGAVGWALLVVGAALFPLPGPGLLVMLAGLALLARRHDWAARRVEQLRARAVVEAARGVRTPARAASSVLVTAALAASGLLWIWAPDQPSWWALPAWTWLPGGIWAGLSQLLSGLASLALVLWAWRRFGGCTEEAAELVERLRPVGRV